MLSGKALSGNTIYKMKVFLKINGFFKLFEIVVLGNFHDKYPHKNKKRSCYILKWQWFNVFYDPMYHSIMGFMESKLKEL